MTKVSILGATGYAGAELVKLILQHPNATLTHITRHYRFDFGKYG